MRVTIFGIGYVGLVHAAVLADAGHHVVCIDSDLEKVEVLTRGKIDIFEPRLEGLVADAIAAGRLRFTSSAEEGVQHAAVTFIAVGTPAATDGSADLGAVSAVAGVIARCADRAKLVVIKSTVPVGTCDRVQQQIAAGLVRRGYGEDLVDVASNPEFLKEGSAVSDAAKPDRIVIGVNTRAAEATLRELYAPFNRNHEKIIVMDPRSAELTKYAANCMLATKISFMNEIANLADALGADIERVRLGIGADPRIGYQFIYPGIGYGGSCFPKDIRALIHTAEEIGFDATVLRAVEQRNQSQKRFIVEKILDEFGPDLSGRTFAIWGLAFKPNTNDMREAPSLTIVEELRGAGARIRAYDPRAMDECRRIFGDSEDLTFCPTKEQAVEGSDALIVATEWKSFNTVDFDWLRATLKHPLIFDGRNIFDPAIAARQGMRVEGVGRKSAVVG